MPLADHKSRVLILDTLPSEKARIMLQYYVNKSNRFWKIMFMAFHEPYQSDYRMKKQMLLRHGIALWNVLEEEIPYEQSNDFQTFFQTHSSVARIIFNGNHAAACYIRHIGYGGGITYTTLPSTSSLNTWKSFEEKAEVWSQELRK